MARHSILQTFYASKKWLRFRAAVIAERGIMCEHCGKLIAGESEAHVHHKTELTPANVHDATIALNPENVMVVHKACHDAIHGRFGYRRGKEVYIVYGMPGSGKKESVLSRKARQDIVVDMDQLYRAVTLLPEYDKPDNLLSIVRGTYNQLLDMVRTRSGKWETAWVIGGFPDRYRREKLADELGAELIHIESTKDEAIQRIELDEQRRDLKADYIRYIDEWLAKYTP